MVCSFQVGAGLEAEVVASFLALIPQASQFHETLNKIFRKKIKRAKVRSQLIVGDGPKIKNKHVRNRPIHKL